MIWAGTNGHGIYTYDGLQWRQYLGGSTTIRRLITTADGQIWAGTLAEGVYQYNGQIWKQHLKNKTIWNLLQGADGTVWATSFGDSLYSFDGDTWKQHLKGKTVWSLIQGSDGILWAGTRRDGLYSYAGGQTYTDLNGQKVRGLLETRSGDVWAMADDGLYRLDETRWEQHLKGAVVRSLVEGSSGKIWAGTKGQGIYSFDGQAWTLSLDKVWAECLLESSDGQIWAGTFGDGIFQFDGQKWTQFLEELGESALSVKRSIQTSDGRLWFGTEGWGLYNFDGLQWSHVNQIATDFGSLTIQGLHQDKQGKIWVVSRDEGLLSSMDGFIWTTELGGEGDKKVLDFLEGSDGAVWAATNEGVHLMGEEVPYLSGRSAGEFLETSNNAVWVATDQGIAKLRAGVGRLHFDFSPAAGLEIFDMLQRRNDQRRNNEILLATTDGVFTYIPDFSSPTLKITLINGKPFEPQTEIRIGEPSILLKWEGGDVRTETANLYYQYRVDNTVWSIPSRYTFQTLRNLVDGPQTIYLRAIDDDFNLSQPAALPLTVDTAQPSVLIAKPVPNQIVGGSVEIHGSILDSDLLAFKVEYRSAGTDVFQLIASGNQSQVSSTWPAKWKTRDLPDGSYQIRVIATDQLGHSKEHQVDIALDNTPPVVSLQTPQANQKLSGGLKITAQANDLHLHQYQLKYTQDLPLTAKSEWESIQTSAETLSASPAQIDDTWNSVAVFGSTLIRLLVQDQAGNQQTADVIVDLANQTAKPGVQIAQPQAKQVLQGTVTIIGTATDYGYSTLDSYQLSIAAGQNPSRWALIHQGSSRVNDNLLGSWDTQKQQDGLYSLRLSASNSKGYLNSQQIIVTVDNSLPVALISSPGPEWIASQQVQIRGTASDDNFQQYRLEYEERSNPASWSIIGATSSQAVEKDILQLWRTGGLDDGQYQLRLTVTDQAGNQTQTIQTLTLDNQKPEVKLTAPAEKAVVSGVIQITGVIKDDNLKDYQLEVQLVSRPTGWERIGAGGTEAGQEQLGQWNTRQIKDGSYRLRLTATDQTGQSSQLTRLVTVDNTPPQAEIATPRNNDQVGQVVVLFGTASDASFKFYQVEFGEGISPTVWTPIATRKTEVKTDELLQWLSGKRTGFYSLRLTVEDMVKHQSRSQVTVLIKSPTEKARGGDFGSADGGVTLYLPPNSLQKDTIVTVNRIPSSAIAWPQGSSWQPLDLVYQLEADPLQLNRIKPATLTISYGGASLTPGQQPTIFRQVDNTEQWQLIGGMVNASQQTVRTAVHQLGRYGVMEMALVQADSSAQLVKDSLTCQPRVFSPIGRRAPNTETTISFQLDKAAKVSIKVYNVAGGLVNWLAEEQTFSEGKVALPWDGRDHQGQVVATGLYIVVVTVGSETQTKVVNVWNQ